MYTIPVKIDENGSLYIDEIVPAEAITTIMDATGCRVYMPGDELPSYNEEDELPSYNEE